MTDGSTTPSDAFNRDSDIPTGRLPPPSRTRDLLKRIRQSADQLERDGSTRGDLKLISRALRELRYAFKVFGPYRRHPKVTVFGSARTKPEQPAYQQAVDFGRAMADQNWLVVTGAASGIMEAGHVGAGREKSMGLNILLPFEQEANPVIDGDHKLVHMKYFFTRKLMFVKECHAVVCCPGGFGTLDEALEVLTLLQTGKREMVPLVLLAPDGDGYWDAFHEFVASQLLAGNMISPNDMSLYKVTHHWQAAADEILNFYKVYHSMRYVRNKLVFRLRHRPSNELIAAINDKHAGILVDGKFELSDALSGEHDEPDLAHMFRLVFQFDRRQHGELRQVINALNAGKVLS